MVHLALIFSDEIRGYVIHAFQGENINDCLSVDSVVHSFDGFLHIFVFLLAQENYSMENGYSEHADK